MLQKIQLKKTEIVFEKELWWSYFGMSIAYEGLVVEVSGPQTFLLAELFFEKRTPLKKDCLNMWMEWGLPQINNFRGK